MVAGEAHIIGTTYMVGRIFVGSVPGPVAGKTKAGVTGPYSMVGNARWATGCFFATATKR